MSKWEHAINEKVVINLDHAGDRHVTCAWDDCEKDGYDLHQVRINYGKAATPHVVKHVFCSEKHKQYFIESARGPGRHGKLPPGYARSTI
jgi:hypothetical protein